VTHNSVKDYGADSNRYFWNTCDVPQVHKIEYKELEALVNRTLEKLPERRLRIFRMHRFEGKKYAEIASNLSLSVKTVEAEMTKALRTLRDELEIYMKYD
jgi:RNA polymerase sigma-70 factor (ECF subfamily)